jgi:hypothetical protein
MSSGSEAALAADATQAARRRQCRLWVIAFGALALVFLIAASGPASADESHRVSWGGFDFHTYGETITVHDYAPDGYGVEAIGRNSTGNWFSCTNSNKYVGKPENCNWWANEHTTMTIWLYKEKGGVLYTEAGPWDVCTSGDVC